MFSFKSCSVELKFYSGAVVANKYVIRLPVRSVEKWKSSLRSNNKIVSIHSNLIECLINIFFKLTVGTMFNNESTLKLTYFKEIEVKLLYNDLVRVQSMHAQDNQLVEMNKLFLSPFASP